MDVPEVAPAVLGEIITMAVAPVFLISALIVLLGLLRSRSMRIIDSIFELARDRALSPHDPLLALQKRRLRHISLASEKRSSPPPWSAWWCCCCFSM
jgi:hypothetical protein